VVSLGKPQRSHFFSSQDGKVKHILPEFAVARLRREYDQLQLEITGCRSATGRIRVAKAPFSAGLRKSS
jgi:hypothetical protein